MSESINTETSENSLPASENKTAEENTESFDTKFFPNADEQNMQESIILTDSSEGSVFTWGGYFQSIALMFFMLFLLYSILWFMKKKGKGTFLPLPSKFTRNDLRVEAQLPLAHKKTLYVVKYLNKRLLIGASENSINLITEDFIFPDEEIEENETSAKESKENNQKHAEEITQDKLNENQDNNNEPVKNTKNFGKVVERFTGKNS